MRQVNSDTGEIFVPAGEVGEAEEGAEEAGERSVRPFLAFLQEHRSGELHDELSERLNELTRAVQGVGKKGTLTLVIEVRPAGRSHDQVFVVDDVKAKLPEPDRAESIMYVDGAGNLSRSNPLQAELPGLREVRGPGRVKAVG